MAAKIKAKPRLSTITLATAVAAAEAAATAVTLAKSVSDAAQVVAVDSNAKHLENTNRLIHMTSVMEAHITADAAAFRALGEQAIEANKDLKSLLSTRMFTYGVWKTLTVIGAVAAGIGSAIAFLVPVVSKWLAAP